MQIFYSFVILENMIVKHGKHMKTQLGKYLFVAHLIGIVFCSVLLFFIPYDNHLRWNLGYVVVWVTCLSAIISFFLLPVGMRFRKWVRGYLGVHVFGPLAVAFFYLAGRFIDFFFALAMLPILIAWFTMVPDKRYCASEHYFIKDIKCGFMGSPIGLYQNNGLMEECLQKYTNVNSMERMEEYEDLSVIVGYGCDSEGDTSKTIIFPIDKNRFKERLVDIKKMAKDLNAEIWLLSE